MAENSSMPRIKTMASKNRLKALLSISFWVIFLTLITYLLLNRLDTWPSVWWDEGWTLDAARNWITHGHLGHYMDGLPIPARIPVRFPVLIPVAISMRLLGVGIWQGRLPGVIFTIFTAILTAYITSKMYRSRTGRISLATTLVITPFVFQPIVMGRQILAEMPMLFYLFAGYSTLWMAIRHSKLWAAASAVFFGIAIHAKLQVPPFWLVSMALAAWIALSLRQHRSFKILISIGFGSIVVAGVIYWVQNKVMPGSFNDPALTKLLINSVIVVLDWRIRLIALIIVLLSAMPQFLSLLWAGNKLRLNFRGARIAESLQVDQQASSMEILRAAMWGLGASWFLWYLLLGLSWERYLFPAFYIGCLFLAAYLDELTTGINLRKLMQQASAFLFHRGFNRANFKSVLLLVILSVTLGMIGSSIGRVFASPDVNPVSASDYMIKNIPSGARVETFESELLFLAPEITFHYPSDLVSMQLNRKSSIDPAYVVDYDPLEYPTDYLVVGPMGRMWGLYDEVISGGSYRLIADIDGYQIYQK